MTDATAAELRIIRTLIPDSEAIFGPNEDQTMFSDEDLQDFFTAGNGSTLRAAAFANYAIAASEALISKKIKTQDLQTDGPAVADAMRKNGDALFVRADKDEVQAATDFFQIVDFQSWNTRPELTEYGY
jgi:hypothetical protein